MNLVPKTILDMCTVWLPGVLQGLFVGCMYVGSGDPVRVLRLLHNEYAGYTLKHLLLRHMYNLLLPKLCATLLAAGAQLFSTAVTPILLLYCTVQLFK